MKFRVRCRFVPQAWVRDYAIEVDPEGPTTWETTVEALPTQFSEESDQLRHTVGAPPWVGDWSGPYEVEFDVLEEQ